MCSWIGTQLCNNYLLLCLVASWLKPCSAKDFCELLVFLPQRASLTFRALVVFWFLARLSFVEKRQSSSAVIARKRRSVEMNSSGTVREDGAEGSTVPCLAITARGDMQVEDDIGDLDEI